MMPKVPISNVVKLPGAKGPPTPPPNPTMLAMAAALMHSEGKLTPTKPNDNSDQQRR